MLIACSCVTRGTSRCSAHTCYCSFRFIYINNRTNIRGWTDKILASKCVIGTFSIFLFVNYLFTIGIPLQIKIASKTLAVDAQSHRCCQRQRKHHPLNPERLYYAVSPPERLYFLALYPHGGIICACGDRAKIPPRFVCRQQKRCAIFLP